MVETLNKYCNSLTEYSRWKTREVKIGDVPLGGLNPIRIQSMTTTDTMNTVATAEQTIRMVEAGCEYVRITAPSIKEAKNLQNIKDELRRRGVNVPLIADIHFTPNAAEVAARIVEKVRVNPGNYADKKKFNIIEYSDEQYNFEIERIYEKFSPLVKVCKEYGTSMRIGTNHGSLSDRIMSRYGDSPLGMVESAMEFIRICEDHNYHDIVLSMKASNTQVMVEAYRLLVNKMIEEGMNYPIHLGVTEAGDGADGRIKSALGIGALLEDGIGDTVRVSLTEEPENEAPVAIELAGRYKNREKHESIIPVEELPYNLFDYQKRESFQIASFGGKNSPKVVADFSRLNVDYPAFEKVGLKYSQQLDRWNITDTAADVIYFGKSICNFDIPNNCKAVYDFDYWKTLTDKSKGFPLYTLNEYITVEEKSFLMNFVYLSLENVLSDEFEKISNDEKIIFVIVTDNLHGMAEHRRILIELANNGIKNPIIIKRSYDNLDENKLMLYSATDFGSLFIDGFGDGIWIDDAADNLEFINSISFGILQAARVRISKTEYIACPSCGRTLFDLVEVTNKIRSRTGHLKGVKIGIMGCIVNGPGEMADADYGYVGSGVGKITLYRGKEVVKRNIESKLAVDQLIELIKEDNMWVEPAVQD
ncbi:MAG: (E)-4-hydroxy-3-methylbut-2-enyl-diphosphate synthase [Ignavibacteria bacterium]|jgi:(E)-4-hydroxy-3-methylbut-2-enyl-diphosphate synthase